MQPQAASEHTVTAHVLEDILGSGAGHGKASGHQLRPAIYSCWVCIMAVGLPVVPLEVCSRTTCSRSTVSILSG